MEAGGIVTLVQAQDIKLGATHGINTSKVSSLVDEIRKITQETGSTITIDGTGVMPLIQQGLDFTANQGKMILLGVAPMTAGLEISIVPFMVVIFPRPWKSISTLISERRVSSLWAAWREVYTLKRFVC